MNNFLKLDVTLLLRNKLFHISAIITLVYIGLFYLLKPLGSTHLPLIILIYNDPIVMGYMFAGVLWLFDKNQNTIQAISVLPVSKVKYLVSKVLVLSLLAVVLSIIMTMSAVGTNFNLVHLVISVFLSSVMFCCIGFIIGSMSVNFLSFLTMSLPVFIILAVPILIIFGWVSPQYFIPVPSLGGIMVLEAALVRVGTGYILMGYASMMVWTAVSIWLCYRITLPKLQ